MSKENGPAIPFLRRWVIRISICVILAAPVVISLIGFKFLDRNSALPFATSAVPVLSAEERRELEGADVGENDGVQNPPWGEPFNGLQFRLRAERLTWQSWQQPVILLDALNTSKESIPAKRLQDMLTLQRNSAGPLLLYKPTEPFTERRYWERAVEVEVATQTLTELKSGDLLSLPVAIQWPSFPYRWQAAQIEIGLGRQRWKQETEFYTNFLSLRLLPPGVRNSKELAAFLKRYDGDGQPIEAGFVPSGTTLVEAERTILTFVVRNLGDKVLICSTGGDYRGVNRHNRFQIEVRDNNGKLLPDPVRGGDFGGGLGREDVKPGEMSTETLDLAKYRTIAGPACYTVSAKFILHNDYPVVNLKFTIPVEATFPLTILPRTEENVHSVLKRLFTRCELTSGKPLEKTIDTISEFGKVAAVPGLARLARESDLARRRAAVRGLGLIPAEESLAALLSLEKDSQVRAAALRALGSFADDRAVKRAVSAIGDRDADVRTAASEALGRIKGETAVSALIDRFNATDSREDKSIVLAALGESRLPKAFEMISKALRHDDDKVRRAAVAAIIRFPTADAAKALLPFAEDADMDFRLTVIRTLAETLRQRIKADWLVPVIRSPRGKYVLADAAQLLERHTDDKAAPALLSCLDFDNPAVWNNDNTNLIRVQRYCRTGLAIRWISDLSRAATPEQLDQNLDTLARIKAWLKEYEAAPWTEPPEPVHRGWGERERTWGPETKEIRIRARLNSSVWPEGLPQVITVDANQPLSMRELRKRPELLEVELNGQWYAPNPTQELKVCCGWQAHKWDPDTVSFQLTPNWKRISDSQPLTLPPGQYRLRLRLVLPPGTDRSRLATSKPVTFRVVSAGLR